MTGTKHDPTRTIPNPNISTEYQEEGGARHPRDVLDRDPKRGNAGATIPDDYDPETQARVSEAKDTRAGREGAGRSD